MRASAIGSRRWRCMAAPVALLYAQVTHAEPAACTRTVSQFQPKAGVVGSAETAKTVAIAYLKPIYGAELIEGQKPFKVSFRDGVWTVRGSLPAGMDGGVAEISICRRNGSVLQVHHEK